MHISNLNILIKICFLFCFPVSLYAQSLATVKQGDKWGAIDQLGNWVIQPEYDYLGPFSEGLAMAHVKDQFAGYIDKQGNRTVSFRLYEDLHGEYHNGFVKACCPWRMVNINGRSLRTESFSHYMDFSNGLCAVKQGGKSYTAWFDDPELELYDVKNWESRGGKWGAIDTSGKIVIPAVYDYPFEFREERAVIVQKDGDNYKFHFIDKSNRILTEVPYDFALPFSEGLALVNNGMGRADVFYTGYGRGRWMYVDKNMKTVITLPSKLVMAHSFSNGMAAAGKLNKDEQLRYGFVNKKGKIKIKPVYESASRFSENIARVSINKYSGYINMKGKVIIPAIFPEAGNFHQGLACVKSTDSKWGFINTKGELVIPATFERVSDFCEP